MIYLSLLPYVLKQDVEEKNVPHTDMEHIPPVEYACETVKGRNTELRKLIGEHSRDRTSNISPLTMRLQVSRCY